MLPWPHREEHEQEAAKVTEGLVWKEHVLQRIQAR